MAKKSRVEKTAGRELKSNFIENHWQKIALVLFFILPLIYFFPFLSPNRMIAGSDYLIGGYPFEKWTAEQRDLPLWYPHVFGGIPVLGAPVGGPLAPLNQLKEIMPPQVALAISFIIFFFLAGLGMYLYLRALNLSIYTAAVGAIIYQFIGNLATTPAAGHAGRAASIATFPLILFFIHRALSSKKLFYFILTALITAFAFYEGHFQMTYYGLLFIIGYVIYYLTTHRKEITRRDFLNILIYGLSAIVSICLLMAAVWLPVLSSIGTAARGVERGYAYATSWALPPHELIDLLIPTFSGIGEYYWGLNPFKMHLEYFGILPLVFAIFSIILYWKKPYVKLYTITIFAVLLVVLGGATPFFRIFYTLIPGFRLFRAPALAFYLISFGSIILGAIGFENIVMKEHKNNSQRRFYIITGVILFIFVVIGIICTVGRDSIIQSMQKSFYATLGSRKMSALEANFPQFIQGIWRSLILIIIVCGMIYFSTKRRIKPWLIATLAMTISLIDQLPFVTKFLPSGPKPEVYYAADDVIKFLKKDKSVFRVFPTPWYEHATDSYLLYHNIQSAGGYIPNPIQRYQDFIGAGTSVMFNPVNLIQYPKFLDLLNVRYIIAPNLPEDISPYDIQTQKKIQELKKYFSRFNLALIGKKYAVYQNDSVLSRVYIVPDYESLKENEILDTLASSLFNPRQNVILEEDPKVPHSKVVDPLASVKITEYTANRVICEVESSQSGFLFLADNWHPDWQVFVDGKNSKLYRADYTFRAVYITAGRHEVIFTYLSSYFALGKIITIIALLLSIGFCVFNIIPTYLLKK